MRAIDADKVKAESREHCKTCIINGTKHCKTCVVNLICERIDLQPTVEPQRPTGEWKVFSNAFVECSQCNYHLNCKTKFCPNCGSDMRKGGAKND